MMRMTCAVAFSALALAGPSFAQTSPPQTPPPQTPPVTQTPPPQTPPPLAPKPAVPKPVVAFPADTKIAFMSLQSVFSESQLGKAGQKTMQAFQERKSAELAVKNKAIQLLQQEIQQQSAVLASSALATKNSNLDKLQRDLQFAEQSARADADSLQQQILAGFQEKVLPVIEAIARERGLYAVFDVQNSGAAYVFPGLDLSPEIVKRLDAVK